MIDFIISIDDCAVELDSRQSWKIRSPYQPFYFLSSFVS